MMLDATRIRATIWDLDGTLFDSMGVWAEVDRIFFQRRGRAVPPRYMQEISGMSYRDTAIYTRDRYVPSESIDAIMAEWSALGQQAYAHDVVLKPGARDVLLAFKRRGMALAVATTLTEAMYGPALRRNQVYALFDAFATTDETGLPKSTGAVYRLAADRLGIDPVHCVVFEDVYAGLIGAKAQSMQAVCLFDAASRAQEAQNRAQADAYYMNFEEIQEELTHGHRYTRLDR